MFEAWIAFTVESKDVRRNEAYLKRRLKEVSEEVEMQMQTFQSPIMDT
jgi:hypothetical protein